MTTGTIPNDFVTFDIETTGLNHHYHSILEIAYAVSDGPIETIHFPWWFVDWGNADFKALIVNKWFEREAAAFKEGRATRSISLWLPSLSRDWEDVPGVQESLVSPYSRWFAEVGEYSPTQKDEEAKFYEQMNKFLTITSGKTLVGAALAFDVKFIEEFMFSARQQERIREVFKPSHRLWDVQMYAAGKYGWDKAKSLKETIEAVDPNYDYVTETDHTAAGDVAATRRLFRVLTGRV